MKKLKWYFIHLFFQNLFRRVPPNTLAQRLNIVHSKLLSNAANHRPNGHRYPCLSNENLMSSIPPPYRRINFGTPNFATNNPLSSGLISHFRGAQTLQSTVGGMLHRAWRSMTSRSSSKAAGWIIGSGRGISKRTTRTKIIHLINTTNIHTTLRIHTKAMFWIVYRALMKVL